MKKNKLVKKILRSYWISLFIGVSTAYFVWLTWDKLTLLVGDSNIIWFGLLALIVLLIVLGHYNFKKIAEKFT